MLDLKSKLLAAGLVTEEQVDKVKREEEERRQRRKEARAKRTNEAGNKSERVSEKSGAGRKGRGKGGRGAPKPHPTGADERGDAARWQRRLEQLQAAGKSEQYDAIRSWVQRARIDAVKAIPTEEAQRFHFARHDTGIASLVLEPEIKDRVVGGDAAISAFMSHNGIAHCVVPRDVALDIAVIRPEWVRVLDGYDVVPNADERKTESSAAPVEESFATDEHGRENAISDDAATSSDGTEIQQPLPPVSAGEDGTMDEARPSLHGDAHEVPAPET